MLTAEQLINRQKGVGGSEAAMVLGVSKIKTARQLYGEKRGEIERDFDPDSEVIWWGQELEPIVRRRFAQVTGRIVRLPEETLYHPEHDFMLAHIDGVSEKADGTDQRGYEGKTAFHSTGWGEEGTDEIPSDYLLQVHHYLTVTALPVFDVATLIGRKFAWYEVAADREISEMLIEAEREFMRRVREGDPPPLDYQHKTAMDCVKRMYPGTNGKRIVATESQVVLRARMDEQAAFEKDAKSKKDAFKAQLLDEMGEAAVLAFPDGKAMRRKLIDKKAYEVAASNYWDARFVNDK